MAQTTTKIGITSASADPSRVTFTTEPFWTYQVEMSDDLDDLGGFWYGDGTEGSATFDVDC